MAGLPTIPLTITNNADWPTRATLVIQGGGVVNLAGCTHELTVRRTPDHPQRLIHLTEGHGVTTVVAEGAIDFDWTLADLSRLGPGTYAYDVRQIVGARRLYAWGGPLIIEQGVSRDG